jgi:hypothetical protein
MKSCECSSDGEFRHTASFGADNEDTIIVLRHATLIQITDIRILNDLT